VLPSSPDSPVSAQVWFAVLGAPAAWTAQFAIGYWTTELHCNPYQEHWDVALGTWTTVATAVAALVALGAGLTAMSLFRRTREVEESDAPPPGRIHFLATVGLAVTPLFLLLIAMTALGVLIHIPCGQS
jgi:hypothetical protein